MASGADGTTSLGSDETARATAAVEAMNSVETNLGSLESDIDAARAAAAECPRVLVTQAQVFEARLQEVDHHLIGLHWTVTEPLLRRLDRLERRLRLARAQLESWSTIPSDEPPQAGLESSGTGSIVGRVTEVDGSTPITYAKVNIYLGSGFLKTVYADSAGNWSATRLAAGTYHAVSSTSGPFVDELWNDLVCEPSCSPAFGDAIHVIDGQEVGGIDFALQRRGSLSGYVEDALSDEPVSGVEVDIYDARGKWTASAVSVADGTWREDGLLPGTYFVRTDSGPYLDQLYSGFPCESTCTVQQGTVALVNPGMTTPGIDFSLTPTGQITGTVSDDTTGDPVSATVTIYGSDGVYVRSGYTSSGRFVISGLSDGTYFAVAKSSSGYLSEVWQDVPCGASCEPTTGAPIEVVMGSPAQLDFRLAPYGQVVGRVTDQDTALPLDATVTFYDGDGDYRGSRHTSEAGSYAFAVPDSGPTFVIARSDTHRDELWNDSACDPICDPTTGDPVVAPPGGQSQPADFALALQGSVTGRVLSERDGSPIYRITVCVYDDAGDSVSCASTDSLGFYYVPDIGPGSYFVASLGGVADSRHWIGEVYDGITCVTGCPITSGTPIQVSPGAVTGGIDLSLIEEGSLSGTLTDALSQLPLTGWVRATAYTLSGHSEGSDAVDANGHYRIQGLAPGVYHVEFSGSSYLPEVWNDVPCTPSGCPISAGDPVTVQFAAQTSGINAALTPSSSVSGTVRDAETGFPVGSYDATLRLYDSSGAEVASRSTSSSGTFTLSDLWPGTYFLRTDSTAFLDELWNDLPCEPGCDPLGGTPLEVTGGQQLGDIDFSLEPFGAISGAVVSAQTGAPISYASVKVYSPTGELVRSTSTDSSGSYSARGLPDGSYTVTSSHSDYARQLFDGHPCPSDCDVTGGDIVTITSRQSVFGIDFALDGVGTISGTVFEDGTGAPVLSGNVVALTPGGEVVRSDYLDYRDGRYMIRDLDPGQYVVRTSTYSYLDELWDDIPCEPSCDPSTGTRITVLPAADTGGVDFHLLPFGSIVGRITFAPTGEPLPDLLVYAFDASAHSVTYDRTEPSGFYRLELPVPGTYYVRTTSGTDLIDQVWGGGECEAGCDVTTGTPVSVESGVATEGVDFALRYPFFTDVWLDHWARRYIESLYAAQVTAGCGVAPLRYCPANPVAREQMAVFLLKADEGGGYVPPAAVGMFSDVDVTSPFAPWIEELARRGVTAGCGGGMYCPSAPVSREQMAVFLLKTLEGSGYVPPDPTGVFGDVDPGSPFAPWIEELVRRAITAGCQADPPLYCPSAAVARDQMGVFLTKTFDLPPAP